MAFMINLDVFSSPFYLATAQSHCLLVIRRGGESSTLCHSCRFVCQERVRNMFPGSGYLYSKSGVAWLGQAPKGRRAQIGTYNFQNHEISGKGSICSEHLNLKKK